MLQGADSLTSVFLSEEWKKRCLQLQKSIDELKAMVYANEERMKFDLLYNNSFAIRRGLSIVEIIFE